MIGYPIVGIGLGMAMGNIGLKAISLFIIEEAMEEITSIPLHPEVSDLFQPKLRKSIASMKVKPSPKRVMSNYPIKAIKNERQKLLNKCMGDKSKTKYVDLEKPIYIIYLEKGTELVQYRLNGNEGTIGDYFAPI